MPETGVKAAAMPAVLATPGVVVARLLLLPVPTMETPGEVAVPTLAMLGVVVARLPLLLLVAGELVVPPPVVAAGKEVCLSLSPGSRQCGIVLT